MIKRLISDKLIEHDQNTSYSIRRIGAPPLSKRLEDFPDLARKAARVVVYNGKSKLSTKLDHMDFKGYAVGFRDLAHFLMSQLPQNEVIEAAIRKQVRLIPEIAIRELVANAPIHQDSTIGGASTMVEIYSDRVKISNPGKPLIKTKRFIDDYISRNENLARAMRRMGICEEKSSGIDLSHTRSGGVSIASARLSHWISKHYRFSFGA